jgi:hypothetical protein
VHGRETWFPTFRKQQRLWLFEKRVLRGIFWANTDEKELKEYHIMRNFIICTTLHRL